MMCVLRIHRDKEIDFFSTQNQTKAAGETDLTVCDSAPLSSTDSLTSEWNIIIFLTTFAFLWVCVNKISV